MALIHVMALHVYRLYAFVIKALHIGINPSCILSTFTILHDNILQKLYYMAFNIIFLIQIVYEGLLV